ncbi:MAG: amidohydrolase family protein [Desulfobacterales bacterium]|nr:amidohydrolase family protein [Desulfobacterales bacterium]
MPVTMFDYIFDEATVVDGSGKKSYFADVGITDEKIQAIGNLKDTSARHRIDCKDKILCPGFIDVHSHADVIIHDPNHHNILEPLLRQGITTFVGGNCGMGLSPFSDKYRKQAFQYISAFLGKNAESFIHWNTMEQFMEILSSQGMALNCGLLVPHGVLRIAVKGLENSTATPDDIQQMGILLEQGLDAGALGMSTGLMYFPGLAADDDELLSLASIVSKKSGVFTSHLRSYTNTLQLAIDELVNISLKTGVKAQISHLFWLPHVNRLVDTISNWLARFGAKIYQRVKIPIPLDRALNQKLEHLQILIQQGMPLGMDVMPTGTGFTHALAFFPPWSLQGDYEEVLERFRNKTTRRKIYKSIMQGQSIWPHRLEDTWSMNFFKIMGFRSIYLMSVVSSKNKQYEGKHMVQIGKERNQHPFDAICDLLLEEEGRVLVFETPTYPGDEFVERSVYGAIQDANTSIVTDTILLGFGKPSHLFYDCFPKLLSKYVRTEKRLSLEEAIRKSTSLPAQQLGIKERGRIKIGYNADLVLFNPKTICSHSTPLKPDVFPEGIDYVFVNGKAVVTPEGYSPKPYAGKLLTR